MRYYLVFTKYEISLGEFKSETSLEEIVIDHQSWLIPL